MCMKIAASWCGPAHSARAAPPGRLHPCRRDHRVRCRGDEGGRVGLDRSAGRDEAVAGRATQSGQLGCCRTFGRRRTICQCSPAVQVSAGTVGASVRERCDPCGDRSCSRRVASVALAMAHLRSGNGSRLRLAQVTTMCSCGGVGCHALSTFSSGGRTESGRRRRGCGCSRR